MDDHYLLTSIADNHSYFVVTLAVLCSMRRVSYIRDSKGSYHHYASCVVFVIQRLITALVKNDANFFCILILSSCSSYFASLYMMKWKEFFPHKELMQTPRFEAEALCYPKLKIVCEYLSWRQAECKLFMLEFTCSFEIVRMN